MYRDVLLVRAAAEDDLVGPHAMPPQQRDDLGLGQLAGDGPQPDLAKVATRRHAAPAARWARASF